MVALVNACRFGLRAAAKPNVKTATLNNTKNNQQDHEKLGK